jgi:hypothetical protein
MWRQRRFRVIALIIDQKDFTHTCGEVLSRALRLELGEAYEEQVRKACEKEAKNLCGKN